MTHRRKIYLALLKDVQPALSAYQIAGPEFAITMLGFVNSENTAKAVNDLWNDIGPNEAERLYRKMINQKKGTIGKYSKAWLILLKRYLNSFALEKIKSELTATTRKWTAKYIYQNIEAGETYDDLVKVLEGKFNKVRSGRIARTETIKAINIGRLTAANELPYEVTKVWSSAQNIRTRRGKPAGTSDHLDMNRQEQEIDVPFTDAGNNALMQVPGDVSLNAPAGSVINCRCRATFLPKRDGNGALIMK